MTVHNFDRSLRVSDEHADAPWWGAVYREAFPTMQAMVRVRQDGWAQRAGIDRQILLADGTKITVDEKVRTVDWPDFALERWSDARARTPGWVQKQLACDFIAYAFVPSATCYLLPFQTLRRVWRRHGEEWIKCAERNLDGFRLIYAENQGSGRAWTTESLCVPRGRLLAALMDAMIVTWNPARVDAAAAPA